MSNLLEHWQAWLIGALLVIILFWLVLGSPIALRAMANSCTNAAVQMDKGLKDASDRLPKP